MKNVGLMVMAFGLMWGQAAVANQAADVMKKREIEKVTASVVGRVTEVWVKDERYEAFHASLSKSVGGVPTLEDFKRNHQWVTVMGSQSNVVPGVFKGWAPTDVGIKFGDIVEMTVGAKDAKEYTQLGMVVRVLCKRSDVDYVDCAKKNPLKMIGFSGAEIAVPKTFD